MNEPVAVSPVPSSCRALVAPRFTPVLLPADAAELVTLVPGVTARVVAQAEGFVQRLLSVPPGSDAFRRCLAAASAAGAAEVAQAVALVRSELREGCRIVLGTTALRVKLALQEALGELETGWPVPRDVASTTPPDATALLLRIVSASTQIDAMLVALAQARDELETYVATIEETRTRLRAALRAVGGVALFAQTTLHRLQVQIDRLGTTDARVAEALRRTASSAFKERARAVDAEEAVVVNGYLALDPLQATARELARGIDAVAAAAQAALAIAREAVRVTGRRMAPRNGIERSGSRGGSATAPLDQLTRLRLAVRATTAAIAALDGLRTAAIANMVEHEEILGVLIGRETSSPGSARSARRQEDRSP